MKNFQVTYRLPESQDGCDFGGNEFHSKSAAVCYANMMKSKGMVEVELFDWENKKSEVV